MQYSILTIPRDTPFTFIPLPGADKPWHIKPCSFLVDQSNSLWCIYPEEDFRMESNPAYSLMLEEFWKYLSVFLALGITECFTLVEKE